MLTPEDIQQISDIIEEMTDEEVEAAIGREGNIASRRRRNRGVDRGRRHSGFEPWRPSD